eukprot:731290-Karenia_brevis.AAC.1
MRLTRIPLSVQHWSKRSALGGTQPPGWLHFVAFGRWLHTHEIAPPRQMFKAVLVVALLVLGLKLVVVGHPNDLHDVITQDWQITIGSVIWKGLAVLQDGNV